MPGADVVGMHCDRAALHDHIGRFQFFPHKVVDRPSGLRRWPARLTAPPGLEVYDGFPTQKYGFRGLRCFPGT